MAQAAEDIFASDQSRRGDYQFGKGKIIYYKPSKGYPTPKEAKQKPKAELQLEYIYGFNGGALANKYYRYKQHLIAKDGKLIYFMAAAGVAHDIAQSTQQHFLNHNDDVTTICVDPRPGSTLVCTGQKDPKDRPGQGKDLPKLWIWDYKTMKDVVLIDNVCTGLIRRAQWSPVSGYLYTICSEEQTLKVYNTSGLASGKKATKEVQTVLLDAPTTRQIIHGLVINPKPPSDCVDELLIFCDGFLYVTKISSGKKLEMQRLRSVTTTTKEKAFVCGEYLPNGSWVVGGASGTLFFGQDTKVNKELKKVHEKPITSVAVSSDGATIYTASSDETIAALDPTGKTKWHSKPIRIDGSDFVSQPAAMTLDENNGALFIGTKSNQIARFDLKTQEASMVIDGHDGQIWGVVAHTTDRSFITAGWDKAIKVWDPATHQCKATYEFSDKDSSAQRDEKTPEKWELQHCSLSSDGQWIAVGTTTSTIAVLSYPDLKLKATHFIPLANVKNDLEGIEDLQWSPDSSYLAAAHGDGHCYILQVIIDDKSDDQKITLKQWKGLNHRAAPSHVQWSQDGSLIKCLTRDYEVAHWSLDFNAKSGVFLTKIPDPDKVSWHDHPLVAGWDVQGLYQKGWDGTDLNDTATSTDKSLIASGDDFGTVRLHNYPAVDPEACNAYGGHAEFVVGVDFLADDSTLLSVGGADMSIFQWKVVRK